MRSANPADQPRITSYDNHPDTPEGQDDMSKWLEALRFVRKLFASPALRGLIDSDSHYTKPSEEQWERGDDGLKEFVRSTCGWDSGHAQGTNPMGPRARPGTADRETVVDGRLRVHGVDGLRVVDASIFPTPVHGNTNQPAVLVGLRAGTLIEEDYYGKANVASANETFTRTTNIALNGKARRRLVDVDNMYRRRSGVAVHVFLLHLVGGIAFVAGMMWVFANKYKSCHPDCERTHVLP